MNLTQEDVYTRLRTKLAVGKASVSEKGDTYWEILYDHWYDSVLTYVDIPKSQSWAFVAMALRRKLITVSNDQLLKFLNRSPPGYPVVTYLLWKKFFPD